MRDILAWIVTVEALGFAALPILRRFFRNRTDAALLCRPLGLALVAYVAWAATLLPRIPFERRLLLIGLLLVAATSYAVHRKTRASHSRAPFWDAEDSRAAAWFWTPNSPDSPNRSGPRSCCATCTARLGPRRLPNSAAVSPPLSVELPR